MDNSTVEKLRREISNVLSGNAELTEKILATLDENRVIQYSRPDEIGLFSTPGRVLFALMLEPTITQRALAIYLGLSETMVEKTMKVLFDNGLITKTKINRKNIYNFNIDSIIKSPDIQRLPLILQALEVVCQASQEVDEFTPF
jgi:predicted transcriptional regulator